jgi:diacylglycerol kinase
MSKSKQRPIIVRARDSVRGLGEAWRRERAVRTHLILSVVGLTTLSILGVQTVWLLSFVLLLVGSFAAELLNAALEAIIDLLHPAYHTEVGAAKDMSSAAAFVLNSSAAAVFIMALLG